MPTLSALAVRVTLSGSAAGTRPGWCDPAMASTVSYPRSQLRALFRGWARRNLGILLAMAALVAATIGIFTVLALWTEGSTSTWYVLGVVHASIVATVGVLLLLTFFAHERTAIHLLRGAWGEDNTTDELRKAQRKGLVWGWVDGIALEGGDLDHFVVTRHAGLVVLDSKWRTESDVDLPVALAAEAVRVRTRAEGVANTVAGPRRSSRHRVRRNPVAVRAAVVVWSKLQHDVELGTSHHGVDVVPGRRLCEWLSALDGEDVSEEVAHDLLVKLNQLRAGRTDARREPRLTATR